MWVFAAILVGGGLVSLGVDGILGALPVGGLMGLGLMVWIYIFAFGLAGDASGSESGGYWLGVIATLTLTMVSVPVVAVAIAASDGELGAAIGWLVGLGLVVAVLTWIGVSVTAAGVGDHQSTLSQSTRRALNLPAQGDPISSGEEGPTGAFGLLDTNAAWNRLIAQYPKCQATDFPFRCLGQQRYIERTLSPEAITLAAVSSLVVMAGGLVRARRL